MKKNYFELANNYRMNQTELNEIATIFTLSTIKRLLGKQYTPFLDDLRRTWSNNHRADQTAELWKQVDELTADRHETQHDLKTLIKELEDINTSTEERKELEQEYFMESKELDSIKSDLATIRQHASKSTAYSDLKDLSQEFILAYMTAEPTADEYTTTLEKLLGVAVAIWGDHTNDPQEPVNDITPTKRQVENRHEWEQLNNRQKRGALEHIIRIKHGQRAVNRYIRQQANKTADYDRKTISLEVMTEQGEEIKACTFNTYAESLADLERIKELAKNAHLTTRQSRFLNMYCSKGARQAEQTARNQYYKDKYAKMKKKGDLKRFNERLNTIGYNARKKWTFEEIGIIKASRQSDIMKQLQNKLEPVYRQLLDEIAQAEPQPQPQEQKKNPRRKPTAPRKAELIDIMKTPRREPHAVTWITREEHLAKLEQAQHDRNSNWIIDTPTATATAEPPQEQTTPPTISDRRQAQIETTARLERHRAERTAELEKAERWAERFVK